MLEGLFDERRHRDAAHDDRHAAGAVVIGHVTRLVELRREGAERDEIKMHGKFRQVSEVGDLVVLDVEAFARRQAGQRQQAEAGQRGDDVVAVHEAGQREAELGEFRVVSAHAAHGDEADAFHGELRVEG